MEADNPYASPIVSASVVSQSGEGNLQFHAVQPLYDAAGWMRLLAWILIVGGVAYCLTIVGILFGWLPIWMGILLKQASESVRNGYEQQDGSGIYESCKRLKTLLVICGILALVNVGVILLYIVMLVGLLVFGIVAGSMQQ